MRNQSCDVGFELDLDSELYLVAVDTEGASAAPASLVGANDGLGLIIDAIVVGETVIVTVGAKMPFAAGEVDLESEGVGQRLTQNRASPAGTLPRATNARRC
jgi:hypothetical protein